VRGTHGSGARVRAAKPRSQEQLRRAWTQRSACDKRAPHSQGAQKSTSTGMGDFSTSASNDASVTAVAARAGAFVRARDDDPGASVASVTARARTAAGGAGLQTRAAGGRAGGRGR